MKILLIWPKFPNTFWSFKYALPFIGKRAAFPPLGLLTVAALLPKKWEKKIIDLNIEKLNEKDILWADFVFISAMVVQKQSVKEIVKRAKNFGKKIVAGGPLFTTGFENYLKDIDHFVLGEAEITLPLFLEDLEKEGLKKIYKSEKFVDIGKSPIPLWGLIDMKKYASMSIQYSRGCPFNCEFCDIILLNGRVQRAKDKDQILRELTALYNRGWREGVFFVDDNFIGNKKKLKEKILPALIEWMTDKGYPFFLNTQVSINLADDEELMKLMAKAGFNTVFVGIESPNEESLAECGKFQNINRDLLSSVKIIQNQGLQVQGGFIIGFDHDTTSIFDRMINFIQKSGIITAMVGLLQAAPKTRLWKRLRKEKRLMGEPTGSNTDCTINFIPKMNPRVLISGYQRVMNTIYRPENYYQRLITFLKRYKPKRKEPFQLNWQKFLAFLKSIWILGIAEKERLHYWKLIFWSVFKKPKLFPIAITLAIYGFHFRKISEENLSIKS
ncbi:B12-binding domain-containing radical SAM protein [Patescibacteria group bacterium]|nr:B12-binding domain-containing radical SAM protein [Patescibacteria group bacterium]